MYASRLIYGYFIGLSVTNFLSTVKPVKWCEKESIQRIGPQTTHKKTVNRFIETLS